MKAIASFRWRLRLTTADDPTRQRRVDRRIFGIVVVALLALSAPAFGQSGDEDDLSASEDLYVKRRPPTAQSLEVPKELEPRIRLKEKLALEKRKQAIKLLEEFLATRPEGEGAAEGLFKLAELYWEEARQQFIVASQRYDRDVEACRERSARCKGQPKPPRLSLAKPEKLYKRLVEEHPKFRRIDLVIYLLGFAATEDGRH